MKKSKNNSPKLFCAILSISCLLLFSSSAAFASAIRVPADYTTIQAAINAASSCADTILVSPGTYTENIDFAGKGVTVIGLGGPTVTIIDGDSSGSTVTFDTSEGADSILTGFTIKNGSGTTVSSYEYGGGIYTKNASPTITNCIIVDNAADHGGGIYFENGSPTLSDCTITSNDAYTGYYDYYGGGIYSVTSSYTMTNCTIDSNSAAKGGGIAVKSGSPEISNCQITYNTGTYNGGGIYIFGTTSSSAPTITDCTIDHNDTTAGGGGGIYAIPNNMDLTIEGGSVSSNYAGGSGGGINWYTSTASSFTFTDVDVIGNSTPFYGGGIHIWGGASTSSLNNCTINNNSNTDRSAGGLMLAETNAAVNGCTISGNESSSTSYLYGGGGMVISGSSSPITNTNITDNTSGYGGGGIKISGQSDPEITNCTIADNTSAQGGGAIRVESRSLNEAGAASPVVLNSILWGNSATSGANEIHVDTSSSPYDDITVTYSDVAQASGTYPGTGNRNGDPNFVGSGDYHLTSDSDECIDYGTSTGAPSDDIDGDTRDSSPDMGSDEYVSP